MIGGAWDGIVRTWGDFWPGGVGVGNRSGESVTLGNEFAKGEV